MSVDDDEWCCHFLIRRRHLIRRRLVNHFTTIRPHNSMIIVTKNCLQIRAWFIEFTNVKFCYLQGYSRGKALLNWDIWGEDLCACDGSDDVVRCNLWSKVKLLHMSVAFYSTRVSR